MEMMFRLSEGTRRNAFVLVMEMVFCLLKGAENK